MSEIERKKILLSFLQKISKVKSISAANELLFDSFNIDYTFKSLNEIHHFFQFVLKKNSYKSKINTKSKEWGDIQTPIFFANKVFQILKEEDFVPDILIEPTMGLGNFIFSAINLYPEISLIYGIEIQKQYIWIFLEKLLNQLIIQDMPKTHFKINHDDIFKHEFQEIIKRKEESKILIVGNPPWITNSELSRYQSSNLPQKKNIKGLRGIEALTGRSNFDITESIIVKLLKIFKNFNGKIALLCKNIVVKNIIKEINEKKYPIANIRAIKFDSQEIFKKSCNASLFIADLTKNKFDSRCSIRMIEQPNTIIKEFGWVNGNFVSNIEQYKRYQNYDGQFLFSWRQGVKHDCSKILELTINENNILANKLGEIVDVEEDVIFPLLKGSDLRNYEVNNSSQRILLTQKKLSEDISTKLKQFPKFEKYLLDHKFYFNKRKSKIYKNKSDFAIFGIGDYTFTPYKVAIAAFYKEPIFSFVKSFEEKPIIFDDTCYFIGFDKMIEAVILTYALNSKPVTNYLKSIAFVDSKRPFTKEILMRINFNQLINSLTIDDFLEVKNRINLSKQYEMNFQEFQQCLKKIIEN
ncbi:MAG: methyltransferase [Asgard group archaeon]|nr:methyltransferase [Asgard group archaeon]